VRPDAWFLSRSERGNPRTRLDDGHPADQAWSTGNLVRPLIHGASYFAELCERLEATRPGDLVLFTDWEGDADERLTDDDATAVVDVLGRADERGVDVRGLIWRSHWHRLSFNARQNRTLGEELQHRGAEALLDMRVRAGGSHHQKMVVIRHRDQPERDVAYVGGIDLAHGRRDDARHLGDPQPLEMAPEYGDRPPWHDLQAAIQGPAVHDVETVFRERWEDPMALTQNPLRWVQDRFFQLDHSADPLPPQQPPPPEAGPHLVQLLRTYPNLRHGRDYPFARGGERSVARGYTKAISQARGLIYLEDQYVWSHSVGDVFTEALRRHPELHVIAVVPRFTDQDGAVARTPQLAGRARAMTQMLAAAPDRVAFFAPENHEGTPVYVHAKTCLIDDTWMTIGSDNFNRRSWTHDSELTAAVLDPSTDGVPLPLRLRLTLAAEHLDRDADPDRLLDVLADCVEPADMLATFLASAERLDAWHAGGRTGERPPGRLRRMQAPELSRLERLWAEPAYRVLHDPDGRPGPLRRSGGY